MFMSCPHCRDLVATDPKTRLPPPLCPRCGGALREREDADAPVSERTPQAEDSTAGTRSIASFLQTAKSAGADVPAETEVVDAGVATDVAAQDETDSTTANEVEFATDAPHSTGDAPANAISGEDGNGDPVDEEAGPALEDTSAATPTVVDEVADVAAAETQTPAVIAPATRMPHVAASPSFTRQPAHTATHPRTARWQWAVLVLLSLLLVLQVLIADRARLAADENWRPIITRLCDALGCDVPAWHQPGAFAMLSRDVRPIIGTPGGLHVQATFRNDAAWTQDWPLLQLSLSDADGRVVGTRAFTPAEYLGKSATQAGLVPGQSARIALQLHEPNPGVVAFSFDFR